MKLVEEINWKTYNPNVYFTSVNAANPASRNRISKTTSSAGFRNNKRINYSLADLEVRLYSQQDSATKQANGSKSDSGKKTAAERHNQQEVLKSRRRLLEIDTENPHDTSDVPHLMSSLTGLTRDRIDSAGGGSTSQGLSSSINRPSKNKFDIPKNLDMLYRSVKPPVPKRKNTNRVVALKKTLSSRRPLMSFLDTLDQVNKSIICHNVYNKKYYKVLPVITVCSICGGYNSISSCVRCGNKICSLRCFTLHNETRCTM
ncbi:LAMI_0D11122g1_1 [Lachancea mirantina]|uniref:LAMI_0D11122g1_1 n=1 Tax=Lachancea mirantina TaxID=1230905 RepID=A0A1G4JFG1_9SACH|nr:LAMI_0D11122g1_1 [Lachancea mirantina]